MDPTMNMRDIRMFNGFCMVQLGGKLLKIHHPMLTVMHLFEQTVYSFSNKFSIMTIMNENITDHKSI